MPFPDKQLLLNSGEATDGPAPPAVAAGCLETSTRLQRFAAGVGSRSNALRKLHKALEQSSRRLDELVSSYKQLCYRGYLDDAEDAVFQTLVESSRLGRFDNDWNQLDGNSTDWNDASGPGWVYLHSLKALAFIRLRQELARDAQRILDTLAYLDPQDRVGADLLRAMLDERMGTPV